MLVLSRTSLLTYVPDVGFWVERAVVEKGCEWDKAVHSVVGQLRRAKDLGKIFPGVVSFLLISFEHSLIAF